MGRPGLRPPTSDKTVETNGGIAREKIVMIVFLSVFASAAFAQTAPEPRSIVAKCNKEAGGHYNFAMKQWVVNQRHIAAKNACVDRMTKGRR
jgi:hypothetical protein